jgi:hypothetical protein
MTALSSTPASRPKPNADVEALLQELTRRGIVLVPDGEHLQVRAPKGSLTPELRRSLAANKPALLNIVASLYRTPATCLAARSGNTTPPCRTMARCSHPIDGRPCLVPAICCLCGIDLPPDRRYLCLVCSGVPPASRYSDGAQP